jgi:hypothetical protein
MYPHNPFPIRKPRDTLLGTVQGPSQSLRRVTRHCELYERGGFGGNGKIGGLKFYDSSPNRKGVFHRSVWYGRSKDGVRTFVKFDENPIG